MGRYTLGRLRRLPLPFLVVLLFTAIMCAMLGAFHQSAAQKRAEFETICAAIEVRCTLTDPMGTKTDGLGASGWVAECFSREDYFGQFLRDVQLKSSRGLGPPYGSVLSGITSIQIERALWPENGCTIFWEEGWDPSVFDTAERVCIVPQGMEGYGAIDVTITELGGDRTASAELEIVGFYVGPSEDIYCPWPVLAGLYTETRQSLQLDAAFGILADNDRLEEFRAFAADWFAEPDPSGEREARHSYALDIDDSLLVQAEQDLTNDLRLLSLASAAALAVTLGAGLLVSFLMIRQRAHELALMQTLGTSKAAIFGQALLEQAVSLAPGLLIGGIYFRWQPLVGVVLLAAFYLAGACAGILLFLRRELMASKEEQE